MLSKLLKLLECRTCLNEIYIRMHCRRVSIVCNYLFAEETMPSLLWKVDRQEVLDGGEDVGPAPNEEVCPLPRVLLPEDRPSGSLGSRRGL